MADSTTTICTPTFTWNFVPTAEHKLSTCQPREGTSRVEVFYYFAPLTPHMIRHVSKEVIDQSGTLSWAETISSRNNAGKAMYLVPLYFTAQNMLLLDRWSKSFNKPTNTKRLKRFLNILCLGATRMSAQWSIGHAHICVHFHILSFVHKCTCNSTSLRKSQPQNLLAARSE